MSPDAHLSLVFLPSLSCTVADEAGQQMLEIQTTNAKCETHPQREKLQVLTQQTQWGCLSCQLFPQFNILQSKQIRTHNGATPDRGCRTSRDVLILL